jgi:hypothetical protein
VRVNNTRVNNYSAGRGNVQVNNNRVNNIHNNVQGNQINNKVLNRNIDANNSRVNEFRGHNDRPPQVQQGVQNHAAYTGQSGPHTFGRSEGNFNANVSSQRGQSSRTQMTQPVHSYTPASHGGGGGGGGHPSGGAGGGGGRHR